MGYCSLSRLKASVMSSVSCLDLKPSTKGSLISGAGSEKRCLARSNTSSMMRASLIKMMPAWVRETDLVVRLNSLTFSSSSRERICCVTAGWVIFKRSAALAKLRVSATAKKQDSWVEFISYLRLINKYY